MRSTILKYFYQYALAAVMFLIALILERVLLLQGLSLWLLCFFVMRKVSFKIILLLALFSDLVGMRVLGLSLLILSIVLMVSTQLRLGKLQFWFISLIAVVSIEYISGIRMGWGFVVSTAVMSLPFIFLSPLKGIISGRKV
jgi:hypothetical protein